VLGCLRIMEVDFRTARRPNGGAIAIGHPLGCSGARLALTVSRQLRETGSLRRRVSVHWRRPGAGSDTGTRELKLSAIAVRCQLARHRQERDIVQRGKSTPARNSLRVAGVSTS
jgi:hypothetical protein